MTAALIQAHRAALARLAEARRHLRDLEARHGLATAGRWLETIIPDPFRPGGWSACNGADHISRQIERSFERVAVFAEGEALEALARTTRDALAKARDVFAILDAADEATGLPAARRAMIEAEAAEQAALAAIASARPLTGEARAYLAGADALTLATARAALAGGARETGTGATASGQQRTRQREQGS